MKKKLKTRYMYNSEHIENMHEELRFLRKEMDDSIDYITTHCGETDNLNIKDAIMDFNSASAQYYELAMYIVEECVHTYHEQFKC